MEDSPARSDVAPGSGAAATSNQTTAQQQQQQQQKPLTRKLEKILQLRLDQDRNLVEALKSLSPLVPENTLRARRSLRGDIERRQLVSSRNFLAELEKVQKCVEAVANDVEGMAQGCQAMRDRLNNVKSATNNVVTRAGTMRQELKVLQAKQTASAAFVQRFQLTFDEVRELMDTSTDGAANVPVTTKTFNALSRALAIHADCRELLTTRAQKAGLEIMESMATYIESGCMKMYRFARQECQRLSGELVTPSPLLRRALLSLVDRPILVSYCMEEARSVRRDSVRNAFADVLVGSGGNKPIEMNAHDPIRYTSDMIAWLHQCIANEKELVSSLVPDGMCLRDLLMDSDDLLIPPSQNASTDFMIRPASTSKEDDMRERDLKVRTIVAEIMDGTCRLFKSRCEGILLADPPIIVCYRLASLLQFYGKAVANMLLPTASLVEAIENLHQLSLKTFYSGLDANAAKLLQNPEPVPNDLAPPPVFQQTVSLLRDILSSQDSSFLNLDVKAEEFARVLRSTVDPLMHMCAVASAEVTNEAAAVFLMNCLYVLQTTLSLYEFTAERLEQLEAESMKYSNLLVKSLTLSVFRKTKMDHLLDLKVNDQPTQITVALVDEVSLQLESLFGSRTDEWTRICTPQVDRLLSTRARTDIRERAASACMQAYTEVYAVALENSGLPRLRRTAQEIKLLLV